MILIMEDIAQNILKETKMTKNKKGAIIVRHEKKTVKTITCTCGCGTKIRLAYSGFKNGYEELGITIGGHEGQGIYLAREELEKFRQFVKKI